jgi:transposase
LIGILLVKKREISTEQCAELEEFARAVDNKAVYRRLQCVLLRAKNNWNRAEIAQATGYNVRHVERIQSEYFENGLLAFERKPRVKPARQYLSSVEEAEFLHSLEPAAQAGLLVGAKTVQVQLIKHLNHKVSLSTVYALLQRHEWTLKRPRPRHPKADPQEQELFKKTKGHA